MTTTTGRNASMPTFEFSDRKFVASHGRAPKGYGSWAFLVEGHEFFAPSSTLTEAKKYAKAKATELAAGDRGCFLIHILP